VGRRTGRNGVRKGWQGAAESAERDKTGLGYVLARYRRCWCDRLRLADFEASTRSDGVEMSRPNCRGGLNTAALIASEISLVALRRGLPLFKRPGVIRRAFSRDPFRNWFRLIGAAPGPGASCQTASGVAKMVFTQRGIRSICLGFSEQKKLRRKPQFFLAEKDPGHVLHVPRMTR
jgi:hypothetical protein